MVYGGSRAAIALGILGLILIWKGMTGNVMQTEMGENIIPRWLYILAGMVLLAFPATLLFVSSSVGQKWLGLDW